MPLVSIIIRTKNEERWIGHCLSSIYQQSFKDFEVILVDNESTDHTVEIARRYPIASEVMVRKFLPGLALNDGIRASVGSYIVCLSAHCIPRNVDWLQTLLNNFNQDPMLAGVYGRQLPVSFTDPVDKRDLLITFGQDRRIQVKDYFFHNANSMIRREVWELYPFDEIVTNIEDRVWGKEVIDAGYHLAYDPEASVYHYHGLHQGNKPSRVKGVVSIIESLHQDFINEIPNSLRPENINVAAVVPITSKNECNTQFYEKLIGCIKSLENSKFVQKIYVVSEQREILPKNVEWIDRSLIPSASEMDLDQLMQAALLAIESTQNYPDSILYVNYDYLERPLNLFDELIHYAQYNGLDTVFPGYIDYGHFWVKSEHGDFTQTDPSLKPRVEREPVYRALYGLGCLSSVVNIRKGKLVTGTIGILPLDAMRYTFRIGDLI